MFIQTEPTGEPTTLRFHPGREVLPGRQVTFASVAEAAASPLARRLLEVEGVEAVTLADETVTVRAAQGADWQVLKPQLLGAIMEHYTSGAPVLTGDGDGGAEAAGSADEMPEIIEDEDADPEAIAQIKELIETRIRPAVTQDGRGDVTYRGFKDGKVVLDMEGAATAFRAGIENMLRHYVPEVAGVMSYIDAIPKPGLDTPDGRVIRRLLDERINPAVAAHGGHISLVDVKDQVAYIRLEGGCQGCGMADVTLKQGVEGEIKRVAPDIAQVLDVTDHAGGTNPYYQPGKGGASPV